MSRIIRLRGAVPGLQLPRQSAPTNLKARGQVKAGTMNNTEARYAEHLQQELVAGRIAWWAFEPMSVRLADNTFYKPDFAVLMADGHLVLDDVKGRKDDSYFCQEDSKLKIKVAARLFPFTFRFVWPLKGGAGWGTHSF